MRAILNDIQSVATIIVLVLFFALYFHFQPVMQLMGYSETPIHITYMNQDNQQCVPVKDAAK